MDGDGVSDKMERDAIEERDGLGLTEAHTEDEGDVRSELKRDIVGERGAVSEKGLVPERDGEVDTLGHGDVDGVCAEEGMVDGFVDEDIVRGAEGRVRDDEGMRDGEDDTLGQRVVDGVRVAEEGVERVPRDVRVGRMTTGGGNAEFEGDSDALGQGDDETVPLQLSVDVAASDGGFDIVVVGVLMSGAQKGPMLAVDRCVPSIE